jgi:hypothetical protein
VIDLQEEEIDHEHLLVLFHRLLVTIDHLF